MVETKTDGELVFGTQEDLSEILKAEKTGQRVFGGAQRNGALR